jgi:hypothetical protein
MAVGDVGMLTPVAFRAEGGKASGRQLLGAWSAVSLFIPSHNNPRPCSFLGQGLTDGCGGHRQAHAGRSPGGGDWKVRSPQRDLVG